MSFSVNFPLFSVVASLLCAVISAVLSLKNTPPGFPRSVI